MTTPQNPKSENNTNEAEAIAILNEREIDRILRYDLPTPIVKVWKYTDPFRGPPSGGPITISRKALREILKRKDELTIWHYSMVYEDDEFSYWATLNGYTPEDGLEFRIRVDEK